MIRHQKAHPDDSHLFRFAVFISSALPLACDEETGVDVTPLILRGLDVPVQLPELYTAIEASKKEGCYDIDSWARSEKTSPAIRNKEKGLRMSLLCTKLIAFNECIPVTILLDSRSRQRIYQERSSGSYAVRTIHRPGNMPADIPFLVLELTW
jgi:hypothetical protein